MDPNYAFLAENFNAWQVSNGNYADFEGFIKVINDYADNQTKKNEHVGPGSWNDYGKVLLGSPDMIEDFARAQMAIWAIIPSPLLFVGDVSSIKPEIKRILLNKDIIKVHQDVMGNPGLRILEREDCQVWKRKLHDGSFAMAFINTIEPDGSHTFNFTHADLQFPERGYLVMDLFGEEKPRFWDKTCNLTVEVNNEGANFYRFKKGHLKLRLRREHKHHSNRN